MYFKLLSNQSCGFILAGFRLLFTYKAVYTSNFKILV